MPAWGTMSTLSFRFSSVMVGESTRKPTLAFVSKNAVFANPLGQAFALGYLQDALQLLKYSSDPTDDIQVETSEAPVDRESWTPPLVMCCLPGLSNDKSQEDARFELLRRLVNPEGPFDWHIPGPYDGPGYYPSVATFLSLAAWCSIEGLVKMLLEAGVDVNSCDNLDRNALMTLLGDVFSWEADQLVFRGHLHFPQEMEDNEYYDSVLEMVRLLLNATIHPNHQDAFGRTVLHHLFMAQPGWRPDRLKPDEAGEIVGLLLAKGTDPLIRAKQGCSALRRAVRSKCKWALEVMCRTCRFELRDAFPTHDEVFDVLVDCDCDRRPESELPRNRDVEGGAYDELAEYCGYRPAKDYDRVRTHHYSDYPLESFDSGGRFFCSKSQTEELVQLLCNLDRTASCDRGQEIGHDAGHALRYAGSVIRERSEEALEAGAASSRLRQRQN
ncbi:uncharacterized protein PODANS_4_305 [Podospora anserina S mat+]|uniref:Podospora anserina S mat+ genomic DNA chromosome 4, supercontig 1 n=1 Tax=Podospora anserina (strain S / ATCC MYA-4624 / DSM 980 / FGSC 10383) TaxID=515849 RepID=B2AD75_PODAN|nr:uncharacterized protein PODANS_4_305 [Podospora anserina S mat+]CAP61390.1 unnamed protein product [Podospora anserina S mat+]CDP27745.1 Putative protein of unknown function [Podospora anserina S mat+]